MSIALLIATLVLAGLLCLVGFVQTLYLESMRLRSRDLPSYEYFKDHVEENFGLRGEAGTLRFSLIKHSLILFLGVCLLALLTRDRALTPIALAEALIGGWVVMIVSSYVAPQALYRRTSGHWLTPFMPLLKLMSLAAKPIAVPMEFILSLLNDKEENGGQEEEPSAEERVEALIEAGAEEGLIEEDARKMLQQVVAFGGKTVREVMTPRPNIIAVSGTAKLEELRQLVINEQYSRVPVYEDTIDTITGYVHVRDMFELDLETRQKREVAEIARPIRHVPETKPVDDLMRLMQAENMPMVVVVDEYGNTAGIATMEDLVEVIVGEIRDEHEPKTDVTPDGEHAYLVAGSYDVARIPELLEFRLPDETESTTVGGLVSEWLGRLPEAGETVERNGLRIEVKSANGLRVELVRLSPAETVQSE